MTEKYQPTPKEYLDAKMEPKLSAREERNLNRRFESILASPISCDYQDEAGSFESDPTFSKIIEFDYHRIPVDTVGFIAEEILPRVRKFDLDMEKSLKEFLLPGLISIDNFVLLNQEIGKILNVSEDAKKHKIDYLLLQPKSRGTDAWRFPGFVFAPGNPWELATLLGIYHEINHPRTTKRGEFLTKAEASSDLRAERDAWAFALWKLKPFLSTEQREFAESYIHHDALGSHSDAIRKSIAPDIIIRIFRPLQQFLASTRK